MTYEKVLLSSAFHDARTSVTKSAYYSKTLATIPELSNETLRETKR